MKSWNAEIVRVMNNHLLTTAEQESFTYQTHYGTELDPGHYLVLKIDAIERQYTNGVVFFGPFVSQTQAKMVLQSSRYLGLLTGKRQDEASLRDPLPERKDANLPILLRRREPPYLVTEKISEYKNQQAAR
jgi:hypothetical protein